MNSTDELIKAFRNKANSKTKGSKKINETLKKEVVPFDIEEIREDICCPRCGSVNFVKDGKGRYKCKDCAKKFRASSDTIFAGYQYTKQEWKQIIHSVMMRDSLNSYSSALEIKTNQMSAWELRLKVLSAIMNIPQPKLSGIVQVDGTYFRESQKRHYKPVSFVYKGKTRPPREEYMPSVCGIFGKEFICCIAGTDNNGYAFADCISLGTPSYEELKKCLEKHTENISYLVSDNHFLYEDYCDEKSLPHHITPSTFYKERFLYGFVEQSEKYHPNELSEEEISNNDRVLKKMFEERTGPHIRNSGTMKYSDYKIIIENQGVSNFDLTKHINKFHGMLKEKCVNTSQNVSSNYLQAYISLQVYKHNFHTKYGHRYGSEPEDKEIVFQDVMKYYNFETYKKLRNTKVLPYSYDAKANSKAKNRITKAKELIGITDGIFDGNNQEAELPDIFNRRKCFRQMPPHRINYLCRINGIPASDLNKTQKADKLSSLPNADEIIFREIYLTYFANEDDIMKAIEDGFIENKYMKKALIKKKSMGLDTDSLNKYKSLKKIFFDVETTGKNKNKDDEILSLSIIDENGNILFDELFKPQNHTTWPEAMKVNNIKPNMVADKPPFKDRLSAIQEIFNGVQMLVGYNSKNFDLPILKQEGLVVGNIEHFDVMEAYQNFMKQKRPSKLTTCAKHFNFNWQEEPHSSLGDIKATLYCYKKMIEFK